MMVPPELRQCLSLKYAQTPAGVSKTLWSMDNLCEKMDAVAPKLGKRGPYKRKAVA
jgi:hypothetical protein